MIRRIPESGLIGPTLLLLYDEPNGEATTSKLIYLLEHYFLPGGEDAEILEGRSDSKFSQKVSAISKAIRRLEKSGLAEHMEDGFRITVKGRAFVSL